ncbi:MAG: hypothetical protein M3Y49_04825, partial [Actinomycetota bacterium]|nr:hypothetical protein [Actinomycetota bacterium]
NYTTFLNIVALIGFAVLYWLYKHRDTSGGRFAKDPVCGMQVEIAQAPARRTSPQGDAVYFCSEHCAQQYDTTGSQPVESAPATVGHDTSGE